MDYFLLALFGIVAGVFGGMGMGGGTLLIPLLTVFLDMEQKVAQGLNILSFLVMGIIALIIHKKNGLVEEKNVVPIILSGLIFSAGGALLAGMIPTGILRILFGSFLILLSVWEFVKLVMSSKTTQ